RIRVGALGRLHFKRGVYVYVGSARRGLLSRIRRHISKRKRLRWHIDWITSRRFFEVREVWVTDAVGIECNLASALTREADRFVHHFGSSGCGCKSHLFYFSCGETTDILHRLRLSCVI
ncbi:MAG: GIY-YIG nuclease family protein, partial [Nitrososphaerota archaeon]